nr:hypothetical protein [Tanacetum cinerariifolium]
MEKKIAYYNFYINQINYVTEWLCHSRRVRSGGALAGFRRYLTSELASASTIFTTSIVKDGSKGGLM